MIPSFNKKVILRRMFTELTHEIESAGWCDDQGCYDMNVVPAEYLEEVRPTWVALAKQLKEVNKGSVYLSYRLDEKSRELFGVALAEDSAAY